MNSTIEKLDLTGYCSNLMSYRLFLFSIIVITLLALTSACSTTEEIVDGEHLTGKPIHYGGEQVGISEWSERRVEFAVDDYIQQDIIKEEIEFDGSIFLFEFTFEGDIQELKIIQYQSGTDRAIPGSSYTLIVEDERVLRDYLDEDGESVIRSQEYREPEILQNTEELFSIINTFVRTHYFRQSEEERHEAEMPSIGYDIIRHDRL